MQKSAGFYKTSVVGFIFCLLASKANAEFMITYSINSSTMAKIEEWIDKDTLVFIGMDNTILMPKAKMFSFDSNPNRGFIETLVSFGNSNPVYQKAVANWYQQRKIKLVEEGWLDFLSRVKQKAGSVYGVCAMPMQLLNIEEKRYRETKELGISFTEKVNDQEKFIIKNEYKWAANFYKGIIFTGPYSKAYVLNEFLRVTNNVPPKIVFIDSVQHELKAVDEELRIFNMRFYTVYYLGAREVKGAPNQDIIKLQERELIQNGKWLEDEDAAIAIGN